MSTVLTIEPAAAHSREGHPENAQRVAAIEALLVQQGMMEEVWRVPGKPADFDQIARVHDEQVIRRVAAAAAAGGRMLDGDTYTTADSYGLALRAAGACCTAVDLILAGEARNGMALVRPPGHHAEISRSMGFCLFNNVAVAARDAQQRYGLERVLILDFDIHHGNGTQDIFYADPSVLFISTHLFGSFFYPGTGAAREVGSGKGRGLTVNVPLPPYVGDSGYEQLFERLLNPVIDRFQPELILISAGFDAHWRDPLAYGGLSLTGYAAVARRLCALADAHCDGRILFVLEGGYDLSALSYGALNVLYALLGRDEISDPLGPQPQPDADVTEILSALQRLHLI